jgi:protein-S-isoprenylcysteine O-methyltransferase Ste14
VDTERSPWWRGARGEWYVVVQVFLLALVAFGPRAWPGSGPWPPPLSWAASGAGAVLIVGGAALAIGGVLRLGANLSALPYPKEGAPLLETGPFAIVRNPIYSGLVIAAFGWGFFVNGWLTVLWAVVLLVFFDIKSRREERLLCEKFPQYAEYQRRVKKLIPWVY